MASLSGLWNDIKSAIGGAANTLEGNPAGAANSLSQLQQQAYTQGNNINQMLQGEKAQSLKYYQPMQQMFNTMYGTGGKAPLTAPGVPGSTSLSTLFAPKASGSA